VVSVSTVPASVEELLERIREALGGHRGHLGADELIEEIKEHQHLVLASLFGDIHETHTCGVCARQRTNEMLEGARRKPVRTGP
jgi:hypothetical protein